MLPFWLQVPIADVLAIEKCAGQHGLRDLLVEAKFEEQTEKLIRRIRAGSVTTVEKASLLEMGYDLSASRRHRSVSIFVP